MEIARNDLSWLEIEDFVLPQYLTADGLKDPAGRKNCKKTPKISGIP